MTTTSFHLAEIDETGNLGNRLTDGFAKLPLLVSNYVPKERKKPIAVVEQDCTRAPNWIILDVIPVSPLWRKFTL